MDASVSLSDRLSSLKATNAPTSLHTFLYIVSLSERESLTDYFRGASALAEWLAPIEVSPTTLAKYPQIEGSKRQVPSLLIGYSSVRLAKLLTSKYDKDMNTYLYEWNRMERAIYYIMTYEIYPSLLARDTDIL